MYEHVHCQGLLGTYDDGLAWLKESKDAEKSRCILWLGSSIGNLTRPEAGDFLAAFSGTLSPQDTMLIGVDACRDEDKVYKAYNDREGKTHQFILNGLKHANRLIGKEIFLEGDWKVIGEYNEQDNRHQAFVCPIRDVIIESIPIKAGEKIRIEESHKYSLLQSQDLWMKADLIPKARFRDSLDQYRESHLAGCRTPLKIECSYPLIAKTCAVIIAKASLLSLSKSRCHPMLLLHHFLLHA